MLFKNKISLLLFIAFFACAGAAMAQVSFSAKVVDDKAGAAIQNASVYFNNTTIATKTNEQGVFSFNDIRFFNSELVIYSPGYELIVFKPTTTQLAANKFVFKMQAKHPRDTAQQNAIAAAKKNDTWYRAYMGNFYRGVVSVTKETSQCVLVNPQAIDFAPNADQSGFNAFADTALVIVNNQTGYRLHYILIDFFSEAFSMRSYFSGYCWYEPLGDNKQYQVARNHCYFGSSQHFYRSLVANKLYEQGFGVFTKDAANPTFVNSDGEVEDNYIPLPAQKILWIDSTNNFSIGLKGKLVVQYNKDPYLKYYLADQMLANGFLKNGIEASVEIKETPVELTTIGVPVDDSNIELGGFWNYEKLANTLPLDYVPDNKPFK